MVNRETERGQLGWNKGCKKKVEVRPPVAKNIQIYSNTDGKPFVSFNRRMM